MSRTKLSLSFFLLFSLALFLFPAFSFAADPPGFPYWGDNPPLISCTGDYQSAGDLPKCVSICDAIVTFNNIIYLVITILIFVVAPVLFLAGGVMILMGGASPNLISTGRKLLWSTAIGIVLTLSSFLIVATLLWVLGSPAGVGWPTVTCDPKILGEPLDPDKLKTPVIAPEQLPPGVKSSQCQVGSPNASYLQCFDASATCGGASCIGPCQKFSNPGCKP